ncbi:MAG: cytochrome c3 family protein [Bacteroidales bacterium]|nr:cytochrome c3 family protein [Bacteroidales bacterium]
MSGRNLIIFLSISITLLLGTSAAPAQEQDTTGLPENVKANEECLSCHGNEYYSYFNRWLDRNVRDRMNPYYIIDSSKFYHSNHSTFKCIDCHSYEYDTFPHPGGLRLEPQYTCMDCHAWGEEWEKFNFETIQKEFQESVHYQEHNQSFDCWMCHEPHSYKLTARKSDTIKNIVAYNNSICLSCHSNTDKYQLIAEKENPNLIESHDWLPNQRLHFNNVRCLECHAKKVDTLMVAHNIRPKEEAVRKCAECHSRNSMLMASLYKYKSKQARQEYGFLNAIMMSESFVIGANRNQILNTISLVIFGLVILGIVIHTILRIIN